MEKFTATSDPYTGVHAFYPNQPTATGLVRTLKLFLLTPIIFLLRLPFIIAFGALFFGLDAASSFIPVAGLSRLLRRFAHFVFGGLLLFTLGLSVSVSYYPMRQRDAAKARPGSSLSSSDLIIANHVSYIDILYFAYRYSPQFTSIHPSGLTLGPVTLLQAFRASITDELPATTMMPLSKLRKLAEQNNSGPVLVFPEGTTTNGKLFIGTHSVLDTVPSPKQVNLVSIRYPFKYQTPSYTGGSFLAHFFKLAGQLFNYMEVCHVMPDAIPAETGTPDARAYLDQCIDVMSTAAKLHRGTCMRDVKPQFWAKYYEK